VIRLTKVLLTLLGAAVVFVAFGAPAATAQLRLVPGSFEAYASNSADPGEELVGDPGDLDTQAGSHPFVETVAFAFETHEVPPVEYGDPALQAPGASLRNSEVQLPVGLVGNPTSTPACPKALFEGSSHERGIPACPVDSQVGTAVVDFGAELGAEVQPVYNIAVPGSVPALLGFKANSAVPIYLRPSVRSDGDYGLSVNVTEIPQTLSTIMAKVSIWGVPEDPAHNSQRLKETNGNPVYGAEGQGLRLPFLTMPSNCGTPLLTKMNFEAWQEPGVVEETEAVTPALTGCERLSFAPELSFSPGARAIDSPSSLATTLTVPQNQSPDGLATPAVRNVAVQLPKGLTLSPSAANGLGACTDTQLGYGTMAPAACPGDSEIGTVTVKTPLLEQPLTGAAYIGAPLSHDPASGEMYRLFLAFSGSGVNVKLRGNVSADPQNGRLSVTFTENPQLPVEDLTLSLFGGPNAALASPPSCGSYLIESRVSAWAGQETSSTGPYAVSEGCASQGRFAPGLEAGTNNPRAGASSPFVFRLTRGDGEPDPSGISLTLPEGLTGMLRGVPYCSDAAIAAAGSRSAAQEMASPSCPASSRIGSVSVGAGPGSAPYYVNGSVYLAGPYKGAPLSVITITPAAAGPYDLGVVSVRAAIYVDPTTTQIRVQSDRLPQILGGVPLRLRDIKVSIDRPEFMQNPTSCRRQQVAGEFSGLPSVTSAGAGSPSTSSSSVPFQLGNCASLGFAPKLSLHLSGGHTRGKDPALKAVLTQPSAQANISSASVVLPKSEFIDQRHINNPCTRVQFNAGAGNGSQCPSKSILGRAVAYTPLLDQPLEGPVIFRSNGGERHLPDLVVALHGQINVNLVGFIDSLHKKGSESSRIRTRFAIVPDAAISKFVLNLNGGKRGILQNSTNLCKGKHFVEMVAESQSGRVSETTRRVVAKCPH
jgi:hypothetical protein